MTITCLIGNGFDLGLGLRTRYLDFLPWYLSRKSSKSDAVKWLCGQIENSKDGTWADAEMAFGRLPFSEATNVINGNIDNAVDETLVDFHSDLASYLRLEQNRLSVPKEDYADVRNRFLSSIIKSLDLYVGSEGREDLPYLENNKVIARFNFITFNYTNTLEKLLGVDSMPAGVFDVKLSEFRKVSVVVNPICYVHGSLEANTLVFGVDNAGQIKDSGAKDFCADSGQLLKPEMDRLLDYGYERCAKSMIYKSDRIICLGLSYGATDVRWWEYVYDALGKNEKMRLLLSPYFPKWRSCNSCAEQVVIAREIRNSFLVSISKQNAIPLRELPGMDVIRPKMVVMKHSPHFDFNYKMTHCDPFNLAWFGKKYVKDYGK